MATATLPIHLAPVGNAARIPAGLPSIAQLLEKYPTSAAMLQAVGSGELDPGLAATLMPSYAPKQAPAQGNIYLKVSPKGGISLYGLQRMPVTLYVGQWERFSDWGGIAKVLEFAHKHETTPFVGKTKVDGKGEPVAYSALAARKS